MDRIPFGVAQLDSVLGGGAPEGSVVLVAGESGAGAREFAYTSAAMNALARVDDETFDLYYGDLDDAAAVPPEVHYLSFTTDADYIERELRYTMADEIVDAALEGIEFADLSPEYFQLSAIPREWYMGATSTIHDLGRAGNRDGVLSALGEYLTNNAAGNLVVIDSVTDLVGASGGEVEWADVAMLVRGLAKAVHSWGGLLLALVNTDTITDRQLGQLVDGSGGTLQFSWESGGSKRARTMVVREFRGVLSQLESENIVRFETEIHDGGLDISDVRKIR
ncbi:RAD55 family ATPase [Halobaculum magnesiiphilum]|uniref:HTR-like protein n=1 Tax=Halobaculum magnesiiphilum TaxID=1017351 RepID=A0A8T8WGJ1_9EURY|nr:HTR-like protein [Halobaculum magnesiiphilum]QZP38863.1 HTR-like protein [Halobaculum magnesiiphilum]